MQVLIVGCTHNNAQPIKPKLEKGTSKEYDSMLPCNSRQTIFQIKSQHKQQMKVGGHDKYDGNNLTFHYISSTIH